MKLQKLKIWQDENFLDATYTFTLEQKRLKKDDAEEKINFFENLVDELYENGNAFKTKITGQYTEIRETNSKTINAQPIQDCETKNISKKTLCSHIKYEPRRIFKKATITITNKGNNPQKIKYFNEQIQKLDIPKTTHATTQIQKLENTIQNYN